MSDSIHPLRTFLQLHLASDDAAVSNLPFVIQFLSPQHLQPSPHLQKWITRVNSLVHSKDPGARWAGLSIACQIALFSRALMLENAKNWVGAALPLFSRKEEPVPTLKAVTRLLTYIFSVAIDTPEFQRQIASPNVPKFSLALTIVAEGHPSRELRLLAIDSLSALVPLYTTLHKTLHGRLSALCLRQIGVSAGYPTNSSLARAASRLYSVLPATGGKVGSTTLWRKSVDEVMALSWASLHALRTTFRKDASIGPLRQHQSLQEDPMVSIPLHVDRLRGAVFALSGLLESTASRAVQLPLGALVNLSQALLSCTPGDGKVGGFDPSVRAMEEAIVPEICAVGGDLLSRLATCVKRHLTPHAERFTKIILFHVEQSLPPNQHVLFLQVLIALLTNVHTIHFSVVPNRITKVLLSTLLSLLPSQSDIRAISESDMSSKGRKGRKRAHDYEGDEIFRTITGTICSTSAHKEMISVTLDALRLVLHNPYLPSATHSLASRVLVGLNLTLPLVDAAQLSHDPMFHTKILREIQAVALDLCASSRGAMDRSLSLITHDLLDPPDDPGINFTLRDLDRLLHPRVPPLVLALPHVESLCLFRREESLEERELRESLRIAISPHHDSETASVEGQSPTIGPALASLVPHPNPHALADGGASNTPAPALLMPLLQSAALANPKPSSPSHTPKVSSPPQFQSQSRQSPKSSDTLRPVQAQDADIAPFMSGDVEVSEESRSGARAVIYLGEDEDEDEEMPSIDMGSDSD
ncbi:rRNA processing/ribosome biogenesis-domain-containing protein [Lactarius hengduanensis]|nr:rRNA processing/ribosome biogenesis-domain-containing protein [Lactarius hengduanensis]